MVVRHNLMAMNSNRMLGLTSNSQAKSTEKLSSGYKINRAADDAAGLAISEKMRKQIRGLSQAALNAQDGISAVQTAEGALNEVQDMLQRMNELAVKASNGTMSEDDRSHIQDEIDQLVTEIDRVAETTKFNETYLLKGVEGSKTVETPASLEVVYEADITGESTLAWKGNSVPIYATKEGKSVAITEQNYKEFFEVGEETVISKVTVNEESDLYDKDGKVLSADGAKAILNEGGKVYNNKGTEAILGADYDETQDEAVANKDYIYTAATAGETTIDLTGWGSNGTTDTITVGGKQIDYAAGTLDEISEVQGEIQTQLGATNYDFKIDGNKITITTKLDLVNAAGTGTAAAGVTSATIGGNALTTNQMSALSKAGENSKVTFKNTTAIYSEDETSETNKLSESAIKNILDLDIQNGTTTKLYSSILYKDAKDGHTVYDVDGKVMSAKEITEAHTVNTDGNNSNDIKMFTTSPNAAVEGKDYTIEKTTNTIISAKDGYTIHTVGANENNQYGAQKVDPSTVLNKDNYGSYFKIQTDLLMDKDKNLVTAEKLGEYFEADGTYKGGLYKYNSTDAFTEVGAEQIDNYVDWNHTEATTEEVKTEGALNFSLQVGADTSAQNKISVDIESMSASSLGIKDLKVDGKDSSNADAAVTVISEALQKVSTQRSALGAVQNRLEHTIANLDNVVENTTAAESQIRDTDMATEMVKFANSNILAQAGQAMLAQANQANQGVLSLLG